MNNRQIVKMIKKLEERIKNLEEKGIMKKEKERN